MIKYSVILPVCHGGKFLTQALVTLANVTFPPGGFEVIIAGEKQAVSGLSDFNSDQAQLRIVENEGNRSEILNAACIAARGSVWVFADDDCAFPDDWLLTIEDALIAHPDAVVLGGVDILAPGAGVFDLALDEVLNSFAGTGGVRRGSRIRAGRYYPKLWNMIVLADAAKQVVLDAAHQRLIFDPSLCVHEDVDLSQRITASGGKVVYAPDVRVWHCRDTNFASFFKRNMLMAQICRRLVIHRGAHLTLVALVMGLPAMGIASLAVPTLMTVFVFMAAIYGIAVSVAGVKGAVKKKRVVLTGLIPALIAALHVARVAGYLLPIHIEGDDRQ
jgi:GT2 family glycosyltransferase